jgi:hypothetical protein
MGKLSDLKYIYETYKKDVVEELNIGIMPDAPSLNTSANPKPAHVDNLRIRVPGQAEEEKMCGICNASPCGCVQEEDGNLSMAKSEVFKILKSANTLMERLQTAKEVEPWQLSKIVKASDYLCSVANNIEYSEFEKCQKDIESGMRDINNGMIVVSQIKDMLAGEDVSVNEEVLKTVIFNIECLKQK